jgi:hypothetical protein
VALVAVVYALTCARAVLGGDNGEFATLFAEGGVAHPSGYPLYTLWLRAWSWLPASSPAHGAALATSLHGALAAAALALASRAWGATRWGTLFALASWCFASLPWRLSTHAEVFALNAAVALTVAWIAAPQGPARGARRTALLGLVAGAGLANHLSVALVAPLGLYGAVLGIRESEHRVRTALLGVAALAPGLATYTSLYLTAMHAGDRYIWGDPTTLQGLIDHILRKDFGTGQLSASGAPPQPLAHLGFLLRNVFSDLHVLPAVLGLAGYGALERDASTGADARSRAFLGAALVTVGPLFLSRFNIPPTGLGGAVVERFHLLPMSLLAVTIGRGFDRVAELAPLGRNVQATLGAAVAVVGFARGLPAVRFEQDPTVERYLRDVLDTLPPRAVVLGTGDHRTLGFPYVQRALGLRRDVLFIDPRLLPMPHYRARIERRLGRPFAFPATRSIPTVPVAEAALATGRPVFLTNVFTASIPRALPVYPEGVVLRVLPRDERPPPPDQVLARNEALFARYRVRPGRRVLPPWQATAQMEYARTWGALADAATAAGRPDVAAPLRERAASYAPTSETP